MVTKIVYHSAFYIYTLFFKGKFLFSQCTHRSADVRVTTYHILKHQSQGFLGVDDVMEEHNVGMLQAFQKRCCKQRRVDTLLYVIIDYVAT